ncbi:MAG: hypothetical protein U0263_00420 [Polyangiaceae bacterium]
MLRRDALRALLWAGAGFAHAPLFVGCAKPVRSPGAPRESAHRVDSSFARLLLEAHDLPVRRQKLLEHGALSAMLRHQRLAGNSGATREEVLAKILDSVKRNPVTASVLDAWRGREQELAEHADAAASLLPPEGRFAGTVYLVMGYDIGVAAPPDIVLNVAHEHFLHDPSELGFYATHEAHHVGFLGSRRAPELVELNEPQRLESVVRYMTQLEGMGVHAAWPHAGELGALAADRDYRIYLGPDRSSAGQRALRAAVRAARDGDAPHRRGGRHRTRRHVVGRTRLVPVRRARLLDARAGKGARALVESIERPRIFQESVSRLSRVA